MSTPGHGDVASDVRAEFPRLILVWQGVAGGPRSSPPAVRDRLRALADRATGARAVAMRTQPLGHAYRSFFRQIGLDPDVTRVPSEALAVRRLLEGGFRSRDLVEDAITVAIAETGVPVWALDAARVTPATLCIRTAQPGERAGEESLAAGELILADVNGALARLFGDIAREFRPRARTQEVVLFAIGVAGVPPIFLEEALWLAAQVIGGG